MTEQKIIGELHYAEWFAADAEFYVRRSDDEFLVDTARTENVARILVERHDNWALHFKNLGREEAAWQPIETAPEGTAVVVYTEIRDTLTAIRRGDDWWDFYESCYIEQPTHWMPLPKPPAAQKENQDV